MSFLCITFTFRNFIMVVSIKIEIGHQLGFYVIHGFSKRFDEFVEILFIKKNLVPVVTIIIKAFAAFGYGQVIIISTCCPYIKEISPAFAGPDPLAVNAFH